jgi:hypothetical protein
VSDRPVEDRAIGPIGLRLSTSSGRTCSALRQLPISALLGGITGRHILGQWVSVWVGIVRRRRGCDSTSH